MRPENIRLTSKALLSLAFILAIAGHAVPQAAQTAASELGSRTAKNGFRNETEIAAKFNNWQTDADAKNWLATMGYRLGDVRSVSAMKPHGEKSDVEVKVRTHTADKIEGISIKLVSSPNGFNQIDKRWLSAYAKMWRMPAEVHDALKLFVGEKPPIAQGRSPDRMYLDELDAGSRNAIVAFFSAYKAEVVSDIFRGEGAHAARWLMVAFKATDRPRWSIRKIEDAIKFYGDGPVLITRNGNLRIGRITMQRKGGDGGRETAKMLQFKINPVSLFL